MDYLPDSIIAVGIELSLHTKRAVTHGNDWVDVLIDSQPSASGKPASRTSVYCCQDIGCCAKFAATELRLAMNYRIYQVEPIGPTHSAPMVLVDRIRKRKEPDALAETIADEYWNPTHPWRYWEVLARSIRVVEQVGRPDSLTVIAAGNRYQDDSDRVKNLRW